MLINSACLLDPAAAELQAYAAYSTQLFLVSAIPTTIDEHTASIQIHGLFNTLEKATRKIEEARENVGGTSTRMLVQIGDENTGQASASLRSVQSGQEVFIVAETAMVGVIRPDTGPEPGLKVHGILSTLHEANEKVKEVGIAYRKWHDDVVEVVDATVWHNGGRACSDGVDEKGGFFWIGARTRTEICRVGIHRCLVD